MIRSDRIFGLVVIVLALGYISSAIQMPTSFLSDPVGSKTFPAAIGGIAILCALMMILRPDAEPDWPLLPTLGALALSTVVLIVYAYALRPLGFLLPTAVAAGIVSYQIRPRWSAATITGVGVSAGLFLLFKVILGLGLTGLPKFLLG